MISVNRAFILGNVGQRTDLVYTNNGTPVLRFSVATNQRWVDREGEHQAKTEWHDISVFGKMAEICDRLIDKGTPVFVEGRLQTRSFTDQNGIGHKRTNIVAKLVSILKSKPSQGQEGRESDSGEEPKEDIYSEGDEDELPF